MGFNRKEEGEERRKERSPADLDWGGWSLEERRSMISLPSTGEVESDAGDRRR